MKWNNDNKKTGAGYFWCGWVSCVAIRSLEQDFKGKERWIQWASDNWIDGKYTIPIAIICLVTVAIFLIMPESK